MKDKWFNSLVNIGLPNIPARVTFANILWEAFAHIYPKSKEKTVMLSVFFTLLGSVSAKAAHRMLMKLTPGV